ncbi:MAG: hypothetical protein HEQ16_07240 [Bosea sp.]|nr:hypothetical protein [Bosea sp. (in: a-proteobacteria)]
MAKEPAEDPKAKRLAAALRENLRRRKAQARGRAADRPAPADGPAAPRDDADRVE